MTQDPAFRNDSIVYLNEISVKQTPTRYSGEHWDRVASDLICGIADTVQDVGLVSIGQPSDASEKVIADADERRWVPLVATERKNKSIWHLSPEHGWLFVPWSREAVEDVMAWTMPYARNGQATDGSRAIAFPDNRAFRDALDLNKWDQSEDDLWAFIKERCLNHALFEMKWSWGTWTLYPGSIKLDHLLKLADPVVARINTENTD